jgi:hypothetical protein
MAPRRLELALEASRPPDIVAIKIGYPLCAGSIDACISHCAKARHGNTMNLDELLSKTAFGRRLDFNLNPGIAQFNKQDHRVRQYRLGQDGIQGFLCPRPLPVSHRSHNRCNV